jgi:hypothetical protein
VCPDVDTGAMNVAYGMLFEAVYTTSTHGWKSIRLYIRRRRALFFDISRPRMNLKLRVEKVAVCCTLDYFGLSFVGSEGSPARECTFHP